MNFRQILRKLDELQSKGIIHFNSKYLAFDLNCPTGKASKYLIRLHNMGFLKLERHNRTCISKRGKICNKGYRYEYSLSSQGLKYIQWTKQNELVKGALGYEMMSQVSPSIPEDLKKIILAYILAREGMRYKGPSRYLQNLGNFIFALPALAENLEKAVVQRDKLNEECNRLKETIRDKISKIKDLKKQNRSLNNDIDEKVRYINRIQNDLLKLVEILFKKELINHEQTVARWYLSQVHYSVIKDLTQILVLASREEAPKLVGLIYDRHSLEIKMAKDQIRGVEKAFKDLRKLYAQE